MFQQEKVIKKNTCVPNKLDKKKHKPKKQSIKQTKQQSLIFKLKKNKTEKGSQ